MLLRVGRRTGRKHWVARVTLFLMLAVSALIGFGVWANLGIRHEVARAVQERTERVRQQTAKIEAARQALPKDAGIAPDWTLDAWGKAQEKEGLWDLAPWARGVLDAPDVLDERFGSVKGIVRMQEFVQGRRAEHGEDASWQALDLRDHTPSQVVDALGQRVMRIESLRELERALDSGLIPEGADEGGGSEWYGVGVAVDLIAFRAYAEARAGKPDTATASLIHAFALARVSAKPYRSTIDYEYPWAGLRKTLLAIWERAPMAEECRERLVQSLTFSDQERLIKYLRMIPVQMAAFHVEAAPGVEEIPTPMLRSTISVVYSAYKRMPYSGAPERALEYAKLVPSRPIDVYPRIAGMLHSAGWSEQRGGRSVSGAYIGRGTRSIIREAADAHVYVWRWTCLPDILRFVFSAEDHRSRHGAYPKVLADAAELAPLPVDPATDKPMEYTLGTEGFSLQFPDAPQYPAHGRRYQLPEWIGPR